MKTIAFRDNITVMYVIAASFPDGIIEAHEKIHAILEASSKDRKFYGISRPENRMIVYRAAVEVLHPDEPVTFQLETLVLKKGNYISRLIKDYTKDVQSIGRAFDELLSHQQLDPNGYCVERYLSNNKDVECMIRLVN
jgi:hypothetical protein